MPPASGHHLRGRIVALALAVLVAVGIAVAVSSLGGGTSRAPVAVTAPTTAAPVDAGWTERGMDLTSYTPTVFTGPAVAAQLDRIKATGSTSVSIVVTWYQPNATANAVAPDPAKSATDDGVRAVAALAQARGLSVVLKPHVDVLDGTFRGQIAPQDPAAWMRSYSAFVTHVADLGREVGARTLVVGTELASLSGRTADWRALIAQVRQHFSGQLTYAANWVAEAEHVTFWDALDFIGIDAYMPLVTNEVDPSVTQLIAGWQPWKTRLEHLHEQTGKPVVFTELGYPSRLGAAEHPSQEGTGAISQPAQARAYEAAFRAFDGTSWFRGIWWWDWPADGGNVVQDAGGYPPNGKLAEQTLTRWLRGAP